MKAFELILVFAVATAVLTIYPNRHALENREYALQGHITIDVPSQPYMNVRVLQGVVTVLLPSGEEKTVAGETTVTSGTVIKTPTGSRVALEIRDALLARLEERSEIKVRGIEQTELPFTALELTAGRVFVRTRQPESVSALWYEITTPSARVAMSNGTANIEHIATETTVIAFEGIVQVMSPSASSDTLIALQPMESTTIDSKAPDSPRSITPLSPEAIQFDSWLTFNTRQ